MPMKKWLRGLPVFPQPGRAWTKPSPIWRMTSRYLEADRVHRIEGGLGNQMFQYAYAWALHRAHPARVKVDLSSYENCRKDRPYLLEQVFQMPDRFDVVPEAKMAICRRFRLNRFDRSEEGTVAFKPEFVGQDLRGFVSGYFPSFGYLMGADDLVRKNFIFKNSLPKDCLRWIDIIERHESVALHVRRGDYLRPENYREFAGVCTSAYYNSAKQVIRKRYPGAKFFVFSDDPTWCREVFTESDDIVVTSPEGSPDWADMVLMSRCKHGITANSSFSLWARWLGGAGDRHVNIAPANFYNNGAFGSSPHDMLPRQFMRIDGEGTIRADIRPS